MCTFSLCSSFAQLKECCQNCKVLMDSAKHQRVNQAKLIKVNKRDHQTPTGQRHKCTWQSNASLECEVKQLTCLPLPASKGTLLAHAYVGKQSAHTGRRQDVPGAAPATRAQYTQTKQLWFYTNTLLVTSAFSNLPPPSILKRKKKQLAKEHERSPLLDNTSTRPNKHAANPQAAKPLSKHSTANFKEGRA